MPGWADERLWISTFASSQKAANLRNCREVRADLRAAAGQQRPDRATARLVEDPAETARSGRHVLPYDPAMFFSGPEDPEALFVELRPTIASINALGMAPVRRWRPT